MLREHTKGKVSPGGTWSWKHTSLGGGRNWGLLDKLGCLVGLVLLFSRNTCLSLFISNERGTQLRAVHRPKRRCVEGAGDFIPFPAVTY